ncbi:MAG: oxaloacetate decarboxylase subunit alpha, partial [Eubacteriales bacterium]|nr:oxaloacetate decarboxylase subunit alpha [Eubacteriales bacterium]
APVDEAVRKKVIGNEKVITHRPADDIPPELEKYRAEIRDYYQQEEDVLSYALFPQVATKFFQYRQAKQLGVDSTMLDKEQKVMPV